MQIFRFEIQQEPRSKSISDNEAKIFRHELIRALKNMNRRKFRGDIILKIHFYISEKNPPGLQNMVKNYLDLMHKPMPRIDKFSKILFNDDDQVKVLIAHYNDKFDEGSIIIEAYRLSYFIEDIESASHIFTDIRYRESQYVHDDFDYVQDDDAVYRGFHRQQLQQQYLERNQLEVGQFVSLFRSAFSSSRQYQDDSEFQKIWDISEKLISFSLGEIIIGEGPYQKGMKEKFRETMRTRILDFQRKHTALQPLVNPIGLIIFYTPSIYNSLDLDNLVKYIVPILVKIMNPPSQIVFPDTINSLIPKTTNDPKDKILNYQIVYRKRKTSTPKGGEISFIISSGNASNDIWSKIDSINSHLEDYID